jgi:hypothetical protein
MGAGWQAADGGWWLKRVFGVTLRAQRCELASFRHIDLGSTGFCAPMNADVTDALVYSHCFAHPMSQ